MCGRITVKPVYRRVKITHNPRPHGQGCIISNMSRISEIEALFHEALALPPGTDRLAWVKARCADSAVVEEVSSLLKAHANMGNRPVPARSLELPSTHFGVYRAVESIGRGGMSVVYRAERTDGSFEQTVALKVMAEYLADPEFLRRFDTERRLLATLRHHNITRLLDGGVSSGGAPYLVTEFIAGQHIDRYCDERKLDLASRLRIFLQVCEAVDYAHRNLIVHRDLKPANILVDTEGVVKLLDFGTASLLSQTGLSQTGLSGSTDVTATRMRMLTPRYASPEQLRGEHLNIATDVFSLGIVLYELLSGAWPFGDPASILTELNRATSEVAAAPPATVVKDDAAAARAMPAEQLRKLLRGDLSAIVMKALEYSRSRRYQSVREFASDIQNFLSSRPVTARPQTAAYRAGKFLRRRWLPATAAAVFVLGLLATTGVALYEANLARAQAVRAERLAAFTSGFFLAPNAMWFNRQGGQGQDTRVVDVLESASRRMSDELKGDVVTEFTLRTKLARTLMYVGIYDRAEQEADRAMSLLPSVTGKAPAIEAELAVCQCDLHFLQTKFRDAEPACRNAVRLVRQLKETPNRLMIPAANHLAIVLALSGNRREVEALFKEALAAIPNPTGSDRNGILNVRANLASAKMSWGEFKAAAEDYQALLADARSLNDVNGEYSLLHAYLGNCYRELGNLAESEQELRTAMQIAATHPIAEEVRSLKIPLGLALTLAREDKLDQADRLLREISPRFAKISTGETMLEGQFEMASGVVARMRGHAADAEARFRRATEIYGRALPPNDASIAQASRELAAALEAQGRIAEAQAAAHRAVEIYTMTYARGNAILEEARAYSKKFSE
jgi:serine/threonine protein kinase/lipopolysaccharide biosynthesis regulator YciM